MQKAFQIVWLLIRVVARGGREKLPPTLISERFLKNFQVNKAFDV